MNGKDVKPEEAKEQDSKPDSCSFVPVSRRQGHSDSEDSSSFDFVIP